ncbi:hypothetical protein [Streptomyces sp. AC512_CC834]|uniref:hypothetical protein n=1 Tax=Streptomyces sp. AC512_CC834 TaxID=2823691 RepID=UPI001C269C93|nr:hypothetical protein [Streptomyces sp. AC512_CC834]
MSEDRFTVAPGTRLLHIGPHKTGTTALQGAFHQAREELARHGVVYAGKGRQAKEPAAAITTADPLTEAGVAKRALWDVFCAEVAEAGDRRVAISSEFFSQADADAAQAVVKGLGGTGVHVVVTLRPLHRILPSHWQQYVKHGLCESYDEWLDGMLRKPPYEKPTPDFWHRQRHDALLTRWADAVGLDNVTVVVVNDAEPLRLFRVFEELLGLPEGTLLPEEGDGGANRSLTHSQTELVVRLNRRLRELELPRGKVVREGVVPQMQAYKPSSGEPRITTPAWAETAAAEVAAEMVANISALGVRVIGDLSTLTRRADGTAEPTAPAGIPTAAAVEAVLGGIRAGSALASSRQAERSYSDAIENRPVRKVTAQDLLRVVARRARRRLRRRTRFSG